MKKIGKVLLATLLLFLVLFMIFYISTMGNYNVPQTVEQDFSIPHLTLENATFHLETFGNDTNEVVIVLHGGPGNDYRYLLSLKELAENYFVVFYDQRGTGLSPRVNPEELTIENMINDLNMIINHFAPDSKINLIGHSWGAMLASGYLKKYPEKIHKIVLAEPGMLTTEKANEFMQKFQLEFNFSLLWHVGKCWFQSLHVRGPDDQANDDYFFESLFFKASPKLFKMHPMSKYYCNQNMEISSFKYWRFSYLANKTILISAMDEDGNINIDLVSGVEKFPNKVLFIVSECNQIIGEEYQKDHMNYFNSTEMVVIKNAGHTMFGEQPEDCLLAIRKYFNEQ